MHAFCFYVVFVNCHVPFKLTVKLDLEREFGLPTPFRPRHVCPKMASQAPFPKSGWPSVFVTEKRNKRGKTVFPSTANGCVCSETTERDCSVSGNELLSCPTGIENSSTVGEVVKFDTIVSRLEV